jgi:hypothetical protein
MEKLKMANENSCGCSSNADEKVEESCCGSDCNCKDDIKENFEKIKIDFLYLDLNECTRCGGTDKALDKAIDEVQNVLKLAGKEVEVNKVNITDEKLARKYEFYSSPTIKVNGRDIQEDITEDNCQSCGDLCGDEVDCRTWSYKGKTYTEPPKELIVEGILSSVYGQKPVDKNLNEYKLPENLKKFFEGKKKKKS